MTVRRLCSRMPHGVGAIRRAMAWGITGLLAVAASETRAQDVAERVRHPEISTAIDSVFGQWAAPDSPGCALGVVEGGGLALGKGYGSAALEYGIPWTPQTVTQVRSASKQFTAMAVLLLARRGSLRMDDDVRRYVPELPAYHADRPVRIRDLLHHASGIRDYSQLMVYAGRRDDRDYHDEAYLLDLITRQERLNFKPGTRFQYSNSGYLLLRLVIERVTGESLRAFTRREMFAPLGMEHTWFRDDLFEVIPNRAWGYRPRDGGGFEVFENPYVSHGPGGLLSSVEDLVRWQANFAHPVVGDSALIAQMLTPVTFDDGEVGEYAAGLSIGTYRGLRTVDHAGGGAGYRAHMVRFPDVDVSIITLCNLTSIRPGVSSYQVADVVLEDRLEARAAAADLPDETYLDLPENALRRFAGTYSRPGANVFVVAVEEGALGVTIDGYGPLDLRALTPQQFRVVGFPGPPATIDFIPDDAEAMDRLEMRLAGDTAVYRFPLQRARRLDREEAARYVGKYYSAEIDVAYDVQFADGHLRMVIEPQGRVIIEALAPTAEANLFRGIEGTVTVVFDRDSAGDIVGFEATSSRVVGLTFRRIASGTAGMGGGATH